MNERVERILANAKRAVEAGLAETDSQQVYELAERMCDVTKLACDMWPRLVDVVKALEEAEVQTSFRDWGRGEATRRKCECCQVIWAPPAIPQHAEHCPFAVLDRWQLRGVWKGDEEPQEEGA